MGQRTGVGARGKRRQKKVVLAVHSAGTWNGSAVEIRLGCID